LTYPYGDIYEPESCNGADYDHDCTLPDNDEALPTGTSYGCPPPADTLCISDWSVIDMSGNLMEWTATQVSSSPVYYRIRGGAYNNVEGALTCQFAFFSAEPTFHYEDLGFRCCADTLPW
jgi:formylglycine-generating enzyme required for sulfatase activity